MRPLFNMKRRLLGSVGVRALVGCGIPGSVFEEFQIQRVRVAALPIESAAE